MTPTPPGQPESQAEQHSPYPPHLQQTYVSGQQVAPAEGQDQRTRTAMTHMLPPPPPPPDSLRQSQMMRNGPGNTTWMRRHPGASAFIVVLLVALVAFSLSLLGSLRSQTPGTSSIAGQAHNTSGPQTTPNSVQTVPASTSVSSTPQSTPAASTPTSTAARTQPGQVILGMAESAFINHYGAPLQTHYGYDAYQDAKKFMEIDADYDTAQDNIGQAPAPDALVFGITLILDQGHTWDAPLGQSICGSFLPADAHYVQDVSSNWQQEGLGIIKMYYSASLANVLPVRVFVDSNGNAVKPGTIFVSYSYAISNDNTSHVGCDMSTTQVHL